MIRLSFILVFIGLIISGCKNTCCPSKNTNSKKVLKVVSSFEINDNQLNIINAFVEKDLLNIKIQYKGGCSKHDFELLFNGFYKKSFPPIVDLFLKHDFEETNCDTVIKEEILQFNIEKLKENNSSVVIQLSGYDNQIKY